MAGRWWTIPCNAGFSPLRGGQLSAWDGLKPALHLPEP
jgi:hypothetical protein